MGLLVGRKILITAGPTWAPLDAVRYIGNRSSGRMGCAVAEACLQANASVTYLAGPGSVVPKAYENLTIVHFETLHQLAELLWRELDTGSYHAAIQAVAGLDYIPANVESGKLSSDRDEWVVRFVRAPKLIEQIKPHAPTIRLVGFKLESGLDEESLFARAEHLHQRSGADLIVANRLEEVSAEHHRAYLLSWPEDIQVLTGPLEGREAIAEAVVGWLAHQLPGAEE